MCIRDRSTGGCSCGTMSLTELRQKSEALAQALKTESQSRTYNSGEASSESAMSLVERITRDRAALDRQDTIERENIDSSRATLASLQSSINQSIDETCFSSVESSMRRFPMQGSDVAH
eukprot:TRINITY_DN18888_c0_g1_i2.p1 TRINITY_DN18888_c0_g1~~TRINITY_DN18888_c0_g1_i2.p1  ORF type:complete len:119 (+),score=32.77 TRINITY_DN18888_c0_g1_i2:134-490(+)